MPESHRWKPRVGLDCHRGDGHREESTSYYLRQCQNTREIDLGDQTNCQDCGGRCPNHHGEGRRAAAVVDGGGRLLGLPPRKAVLQGAHGLRAGGELGEGAQG